MKQKYLHILFGDSAYGAFKYFLRTNTGNEFNGDIINFRDDLSIGSIYNLTINNKRYEYFNKLFRDLGWRCNEEGIKNDILSNYDNLLRIDKNDKIVIWYGNNTRELLAFRFLVDFLKDNEIYEINVSQCKVNDNEYCPRAVAECTPETLGEMLVNVKQIKEERIILLKNEWEEVTKSKGELRIVRGGRVVNVDESYFDKRLLKNIGYDFENAARVVGTVMGSSEEMIGDIFLHYRLICLIREDIIDYEGEIESLRNLKVKRI